ncbi:phosphatase 2C-domain-containing protein [Phycomyces blakesleeanus]|uniref:Phosphatase 2C-domain-containing protein n=1 Tax=Phycomyces blakesleeanus TaxID=4837 RepID=A0ABR3ATJ0_PHYBL
MPHHNHSHHHSAADSFFNRVFGHHSSESSRAGSPTPQATPPIPTQTLSSTTPRASSRHTRNSSIAYNINTPYSAFNPSKQKEQQKEQHQQNTMPTTRSQDASRQQAKHEAARAPKINTVPFPRGGRHIGEAGVVSPVPTSINPLLRRSNSGEMHKNDPGQSGMRVDSPNMTNNSTHSFAYTGSSVSSVPSNASTSSLSQRKKSSEHDYRSGSLHPLDVYVVDEPLRFMQRGPHYFNSTAHIERKRSGGSSGTRKGKDREKSDNNLYYSIDHQNFGSMEGIVNSNYYNSHNMPFTTSMIDPSMGPEIWEAPDSWAVQTAIITGSNSSIMTGSTLVDNDPQDFEDNVVQKPDWGEAPKKNVNMNKYRLVLKTNIGERVLQATERPVYIQKDLLVKSGYTDEDIIENVGIEDTSYLFRFIFEQKTQQQAQEELGIRQHVDLQAQNLPAIPIYLFKNASRIVSLNVSKNLLMEIPVDFAQMCISLKELRLTNCEYSTVPPSIRFVYSLESLNMSNNCLTTLEPAQLENIKGLNTLTIYNNKLSDLPSSFSSFKQLTVLMISNNDLSIFPAVIGDITSLVHLDISFNKITTIPDCIGNLTNLNVLLAIANRIKGGLPPSFAGLQSLRELDIRQNSITDIDVLSKLPNLHSVSADYNSVGIINCELNNIRQLKMCKNHLTHFNLLKKAEVISNEIPNTITTSPENQLTELNLSNCKLSSLPDELFLNTTLLERLILDNNTLTSIPDSIGVLSKLIHLSIHTNNIDSLPVEIAKLGNLKTLDAQKNNLKTLPKEIWLCLSLDTLNCSSNLLESFPVPYSAPVSDGVLPTQLGSNAGQGIVPMTPSGSPNEPALPTFIVTDSSIEGNFIDSGIAGEGSSPNSALSQRPPNFNPPSFFASPRNHPPPLSLSLRTLLLGDNRLTDDVWSPLSLFLELRTLNLSFNDLYEIPPEGLCHQHLYELYLSGNNLTSLPADDIERLSFLRVLAVNGNKLQTLPAEIGKLRKLLVLDVGNNVLKYNIANWPYDWNCALKHLHMLGLMDITILGVSVPEESDNCRVRTSPSDVNGMDYGVADWLGRPSDLATWDLVMPKFRNKDDECVFGLFDGRSNTKSCCKVTKFLNKNLTISLNKELNKNKHDDSIVSAIRRTFLSLEKELGLAKDEKKDSGASAVMCYISGTKLYVANVGDALAVISRNNGQAYEITQKHIPLNPGEVLRIHAAGGYVSSLGQLNSELAVSRSFGHFHLVPVVNANPYVSTIQLTHADEFVIMASRGLWDRMSYQTAVDIARTEKDDFMAAAQKLRDFAISYGSGDSLMVMVIGVGDLFHKREKKMRNRGNMGSNRGPDGTGMMGDDGGMVGKSKRRGKEDGPGDSTLARLEKEVHPPMGQVALVFTDIKSSTQYWETQPENMRASIKIHDAVMRRTLRSVGGYEVKTEGDAFMVCFQNITAALLWCFTVQLQLLEADWPAGIVDSEEGKEITKDDVVIYKGLSVRMGIHWGTPVFERNPITNRMDYFGPVVNKASRISNAADGGQICVSSDVVAALRNFPIVFSNEQSLRSDEVGGGVSITGNHSIDRDLQQLKRLGFHIMELGERYLKGLETPEMLSLVYPGQLLARTEISIPKSEIFAPVHIGLSPSPSSELSAAFVDTVSDLQVNDSTDVRKALDKRIEDATAAVSVSLPRAIDPMLICSVGNIALRLEHITSNSVLSRTNAGSSLNNVYTSDGIDSEAHNVISNATTPYGQVLDRHIKEVATDEELILLLDNYVSRVEVSLNTYMYVFFYGYI